MREEEEALDRTGGERGGDAALKRKRTHTHTPTYTQYVGNGFQLCSPLGCAPIKQTSSTEKYVYTHQGEWRGFTLLRWPPAWNPNQFCWCHTTLVSICRKQSLAHRHVGVGLSLIFPLKEIQVRSYSVTPQSYIITTAHCLVQEGSHSVHSRFSFCKTVRLGFGRCATDVARHIYKVQRQWGLGSRQWLASISFGRTYIAFDYWRSLPSARFFIAFTSPISADSCLQSLYVGNSGMSTAGNLRAVKAQHFSEDPCCSVIFVIQYLLSFFQLQGQLWVVNPDCCRFIQLWDCFAVEMVCWGAGHL